jgi:hypothetical protein
LARRRSGVSLTLLPTDRLSGETAAFDVLIDEDYAGHWVETTAGRAAVTWVGGGECVETEPCQGDKDRAMAAIRATIPASRLGPAADLPPPQYDLRQVEALLLEVSAEFKSKPLSVERLALRIICDPHDHKERETVTEAIRRLREVDLIRDREDDIVELTPGARRAIELFT